MPAIGPYELGELLGKGGMAEVYRAVRKGPGHFEKNLALKRILPSKARDADLVVRFLEEARLSALLDHSNLVQVVDFGNADGELYLVMELVDGASLSRVLSSLADRGERLPPEIAAFVISEAATGLARAHALADEEGRSLSLVHRDIAPQNILLSRTGDVKVGDFGIAKVVGSQVRTTAGVLIGRVPYMSPEQLCNESLDARTDVYALGIVLWECLSGRPLFPRATDAAALLTVSRPDVAAPSTIAPVPTALDAIVLQALAPERAQRTPTAHELARALRVWLHGVAPGFGQADLAAFLGGVLPAGTRPSAEPATRREGRRAAPASAAPAPVEQEDGADDRFATRPMPSAPAEVPATRPTPGAPAEVATTRPTPSPPGEIPTTRQMPGAALALPIEASPSNPKQRSRARRIAGVGVVVLLAAGVAAGARWGLLTARDGAVGSGPDVRPTITLETVPPGARVFTEEGMVGRTPMSLLAPERLALALPGHEPVVFRGSVSGLARAPVRLVKTKNDYAILDVDCGPSGRVRLDGRDLGPSPVFVAVELERGAPRGKVEIAYPEAPPRIVDVHLASGRPWRLVPVRADSGCPAPIE